MIEKCITIKDKKHSCHNYAFPGNNLDYGK